VVLTFAVSLVAIPALAAPVQPPPPSTSSDAKAAWENSTHLAEAASEQVNGAKQAALTAAKFSRQAAANLAVAVSQSAASQQASAAAAATVASYQTKIDAFTSASFRGARLSQFSVMLTAKSADDFLDEATVVSRIAQDTQKTLNLAVVAKTTAARVQGEAAAAETAAATAKTQADAAGAAAVVAIATATTKKADLDTAVIAYQALYNKLSTQEKAAIAAAAEVVRQQSITAAAAVQAAANTAAAAARQAAAVPVVKPAATPTTAQGTSAASAASPVAATSSGVSGGDAAGRGAAAAALTKVGFPYVYGGNGPSSYDCSGLTTWAWGTQGISIPRTSYEQANFPQVPLDQLQPGDLVTYYSPVSHVAIYVGNGMVVSAADEEIGIVLRPVTRGGPDPTGHRVPRG